MNKKKIIIPSLIAILTIASAGTIVAVSQVLADTKPIWSEVNYQTNYNYYDSLEVQDRVFASDGNQITASHVITYPDGAKTDKNSIVLEQVGNYMITYSALSKEKLYTKVEKFNVHYGAYYFESTKSSASYGKTERADSEGLIINLAKDDSFHLTKHITFKDLTKNDLLIKGYISPAVIGSPDFSALTFKFVDSVDPSIYLRCSYFSYETTIEGGWSYAGAGGNDQQICGWLASKGQVYRGEGTGASMMTSFSGIRRNSSTYTELRDDAYPFQVSLDMKDMIVYGYNGTLICDLDSSTYFEKAWSGFPSGKADLIISCDGYSSGSGTIVLTDIIGYDDLSNLQFEDATGPNITLNSEYDELPSGVINKSYAIPNATAYDDYSKDCKVKTEVVYDYASKNPINITVLNGQFTPTKSGPYAIRYSSTDKSNNTSYLIKVVNIYDKLDPIIFDLPSDKLTSCEVGDEIIFTSPINIKGGSGNKSYRIHAKYGDKNIEIKEGETFVPDEIGEWTIEYIVKDYLNQESIKSYKLNVSMENEYTLKGEPSFLTHYISNVNYDIPDIELFHKVNNKVQLEKAKIQLLDSNGTVNYDSGSSFKPVVSTNGTNIKFSVMGGTNSLFDIEAKCIIPFTKEVDEDGLSYNKLNLLNYFDGNNINYTDTNSLTKVGLKVRTTTENGSLKFVNPIKNDNVSLSLYKIYSRNESAEIDIKLIDSYNPNKVVTAKAVSKGVNLYFEYDGHSSQAEYPFSNAELNSVEFSFNGKYINIGNLSAEVKTYDNGLPFDGFNNKVYIVIENKSFDDGDEYVIRTIGNHNINLDSNDKAAPTINLEENYYIAHEYEERFKIPNASAFDILSPNVNFTITVIDDDKNPVTAVDGTLLQNASYKDDYEIDLTKYGQYHITYSATEASDFIKKGNTSTLECYITVFDKIPPTLTITSGYTTEVNVGEYIIVPNYEVSDNNTPIEEIRKIVTVTDPSGKKYYLDNTTEANRQTDVNGNKIPAINAFKVAQAGEHIVTIMIADESGNVDSFTYKVLAKEAQ